MMIATTSMKLRYYCNLHQRVGTARNNLKRYLSLSSSIVSNNNNNNNTTINPFCQSTTTTTTRTMQGSRLYYSTTSTLSNNNNSNNHYNIAIVGSGPSGCYTAKYLKMAFDKDQVVQVAPSSSSDSSDSSDSSSTCSIHILERLPTPYGLVRYGVAPDHPEVKNVQNDFDVLFDNHNDDNDDNNENKNSIQFYGNINVGKDISIETLRELYDIVILAYGCDSDRKLPGFFDDENNNNNNNAQGILSAREFVAWYNGHPDYAHIGNIVANVLGTTGSDDNNDASSSLPAPAPPEVVIIGQGNVALDCARILAKGGSKSLYDTDIASYTLPILGKKPVNKNSNGSNESNNNNIPVPSKITIVGRRGHIQGAYTIKELRELTKLYKEGYHSKLFISEEELDLGIITDASKEELKQSRPKQRIDKLLRQQVAVAADNNTDINNDNDNKEEITQVELRFLLNPIQFETTTITDTDNTDIDKKNKKYVSAVICERTKLEGDAFEQRAVSTGEQFIIPAQLVLVSIGYKGISLPGLEQYYDSNKGVLHNIHGKILDNDDVNNDNNAAPLYVSGWLKRGPTGIIGTNIGDAKDTVATILKDIVINNENKDNDTNIIITTKHNNDIANDLLSLLQKDKEEEEGNNNSTVVVTWSKYQNIVNKECNEQYKRSPNQPREKITTIKELLQAASSTSSSP